MSQSQSNMNFAGKVVLITGASSGIGAASAVKFARLGASLTLTGRNSDNLKKTSTLCDEAGGTKGRFTLAVEGSLTNEDDVKKILSETLNKFGRLDVLVNNAGIMESGSIENTNLEQYDRVFDLNVRAVYNLTMQAVPHLIKTKGNIVNVSSVCGIRAFPGILAYNMSKSAIDQFTKSVALELAPKGVRVNSVNPGVIVTELQKRGGMVDDASYQKFLDRSKETHPLGRVGQPDEVADAIAYLASDQATFVTANLLSVDGGRHAACPR